MGPPHSSSPMGLAYAGTTTKELGNEFCSQLQRGQLNGTLLVSKRTAEYLRAHVVHNRYPDAVSLLHDVKKTGATLQQAKPGELVIGNIVRRVLRLVREEQQEEIKEQSEASTSNDETKPRVLFPFGGAQSSLLDLGLAPIGQTAPVGLLSLQTNKDSGRSAEKTTKKVKNWKGKQSVIDGINELIEELDNIPMQIAQEGLELIHAHEMVLTYGYSDTVLQFLIAASETRPDLEVIVAEAAPELKGREMAKKLCELKIKTTIITDAAVFALMARVNKVFVGCHEVVTDGSVVVRSGISTVAAAAKHYSVPFVVLAGTHKLCPIFPKDPFLTLNELKSSYEIAEYNDIPHLSDEGISVVNPAYDFIPPDQISLLVTDQGGVTPNYVYRLMSEYYAKEDYDL